MSLFDRYHYWKVALALQKVSNNETKYEIILALCDMFQKDNMKFQPDLFIDVAEKTDK